MAIGELPTSFRQGQRGLSARQMNNWLELTKQLSRENQELRRRIVNLENAQSLIVHRLYIEDIDNGDYLLCATVKGAANRITVLRPYLLQRTPFDGKARDGFTYTYQDAHSRTSRRVGSTTDEEKQVVVPRYVVGDEIDAVYGATNQSTLTGDDSGVAFLWLDLNMDGREWAKASS